MNIRKIIAFSFIVISFLPLISQPLYLPLNEDYNRPLLKEIYSNQNHFHTSFRPYFILDIVKAGINYDSIHQLLRIDKEFKKKWKQKTWDKVFNDDVATFKRDDYSIIANPLMDFTIGNAGIDGKTTWINTRGLELKGRIGDNFGYYTNFYENQSVFPAFINSYVKKTKIVPGQGIARPYGDGGFDYSSATGYITYQASNYFNFQFGHGKNFYGDGYRSLLLSDNSFNNLFFKVSVNFWHIKYQVVYNQYIDIRESVDYGVSYPRKYSTTHYLSWAASKRLNISFFDAIVWSAYDSTGTYRGFDFQYLNPIIFMRPVEFGIGSPDNALIGLNMSYIINKHNIVYGQLIIDEFRFSEIASGNGWYGNKQGFQLGFKTFDIFKIKNLYLQTEFNWVRPYTYSQRQPIKNYGHYNQPIAHPYGANFWESVSFIKYNWKRIFIDYQFLYSVYGEDPPGMNYGKDIYLSYNTRVQDYDNYVGQGISTTLVYNNINISYLINPTYNLNLSVGYTNRQLTSDTDNQSTSYFYLGLRTSLRNIYYDF